MKVPAEINTTVYVDVDPSEIIAELPWEFAQPEAMRSVLQMLNRCAACIKAVSPDIIGQMTPAQRNLIAKYLISEVTRFSPNEPRQDDQADGFWIEKGTGWIKIHGLS